MTCFITFDRLIINVIMCCIIQTFSFTLIHFLSLEGKQNCQWQILPLIWKYFLRLLAFNSKYKELHDLLHHLWHTNHQRHNMMHLLIVFIHPDSFLNPQGKKNCQWQTFSESENNFQHLLALTSKHKELHDLLHHLWHTNHQRHNTMHLLIVACQHNNNPLSHVY